MVMLPPEVVQPCNDGCRFTRAENKAVKSQYSKIYKDEATGWEVSVKLEHGERASSVTAVGSG